jgi:hypothetical protein
MFNTIVGAGATSCYGSDQKTQLWLHNTVIYPNCAIFSGKAGAVWINTAPTLILILKYENINLKKESQAEEAQHLNYRIKSEKGH